MTKQNWKEGSWLVNDPSGEVTHQATEDFIDSIQIARREGYGFVPFVGAGFSAPSGAPIIWELESYLQRCINMTLGNTSESWNPQTDQWPPFIDRDGTQNIRAKPKHYLNEIRNKLMDAEAKELNFYAQGLGAAAEWRSALLFLSRLRIPPRGSDTPPKQSPKLTAPQQEIIDSCFREALKEKYPALGHKMLAVLAGALRLDLVLTTNFDDLLERAFAAARNPLEVCEIHLDSSLPHWSAVSDVRTLIKMHGNRYSLRADYSLDELPSENDKRRFLEYLLSGKGRSQLAQNQKTGLDFQNHLLVMGVSSEDTRTKSLIKYAWQHLHKDFRVFWLCYTPGDIKKIHDLTAEFYGSHVKGGRKYRKHSIILRHTEFGLFLLQLYQAIRKNLPPLGGLFPSVSRLTLPPLPSTYSSKHVPASTGKNNFCEEVNKCLDDFQEEGFAKTKLVVVTASDDVRGVTSACSQVYRKREEDHNNMCLWMDMNDISSTDNLFEVLLEAAYFRLGLEHWTPVYLASELRPRAIDSRPRVDEILRLVGSVAKHWVIFLNARETPGVNTTDKSPSRANRDEPDDLPNGWLDELGNNLADESACMRKFVGLLRDLCGVKSPVVSVVLMCRNEPKESPLIKELKESQIGRAITLNKNSKEQVTFSEDLITAEALAWTKGDKHKQRFLHALVLMQRPRLLATIWSSAVSRSDYQPAKGPDVRPKWVSELEETGLLRRKSGGFIWIHSRCRQKIREKLADSEERKKFLHAYSKAERACRNWNPKIDEPEIHEKLAEWYEKVLDASESPAAVFEAVYHFCRAAETLLDLNKDDTKPACERLEAAAAILKANSFLIQTHGYSRGSCRHLEYIRDTLCKSFDNQPQPELTNATHRLRVVCTEVMRMIAREVGEDGKLYLRHREFGTLLAEGKWTPVIKELCKKQSKKISKKLYDALSRLEPPHPLSNSRGEWLRWLRWCGMLGIASRSFPIARHTLEKALWYATQTEGSYPASPKDINWARPEELDFKIFERNLSNSERKALQGEVLRIVEQYVELLLLEDGVANRLRALAEGDNFTLPAKIEKYLARDILAKIKTIEGYISVGQKLVSDIRSHDHSADAHNTIGANWCEGRLLMHKSICASRRVQLNSGKEDLVLQNAMALLGDAESGLRVSDPRRRRSELSMIELHRADARLHQAESVQIYEGLKQPQMSFAKMCRDLELWSLQSRTNWLKEGKELRVKYLGPKNREKSIKAEEKLRRAKSLVIDSMRFLNRAEPVLRARRRNVWWTTWFFERRLRAVALSVWASVFEIDTPIPFLGLEAAMKDTDTVADTLLEDAIRMIRVDAYRLATIVDAYASCAKALWIRLILDPNTARQKERQQKMREELNKALESLNRVEERRNNFPVEWKTKGGLDKGVKDYIDAIRGRTGIIIKQLEDEILD